MRATGGALGARIANQIAAPNRMVAPRVRSGRYQSRAVSVAAIDCPATAAAWGKSSVYGSVVAALLAHPLQDRGVAVGRGPAPRQHERLAHVDHPEAAVL